MWPQQTWGQRSSRGQWPFVQVFGKKGQCIHILRCIFKSNITMIAKSMWSRKQARLVVREPPCLQVCYLKRQYLGVKSDVCLKLFIVSRIRMLKRPSNHTQVKLMELVISNQPLCIQVPKKQIFYYCFILSIKGRVTWLNSTGKIDVVFSELELFNLWCEPLSLGKNQPINRVTYFFFIHPALCSISSHNNLICTVSSQGQ